MGFSYKDKLREVEAAVERLEQEKLLGEAGQYRSALEKSAFSDAGAQYGQGIRGISNYLARSGPLADSGAKTALRARLASQVYGGARSKILGSYADYLRSLQSQRRQFNYEKELLRYQKDLNKKGPLDYLAGFGGGLLGGGGGGGYRPSGPVIDNYDYYQGRGR